MSNISFFGITVRNNTEQLNQCVTCQYTGLHLKFSTCCRNLFSPKGLHNSVRKIGSIDQVQKSCCTFQKVGRWKYAPSFLSIINYSRHRSKIRTEPHFIGLSMMALEMSVFIRSSDIYFVPLLSCSWTKGKLLSWS